jgi:hypothetical protein
MLEMALRRYQNRSIEAAQVIEEFIDIAMLGETLGLAKDEISFYESLEIYHCHTHIYPQTLVLPAYILHAYCILCTYLECHRS